MSASTPILMGSPAAAAVGFAAAVVGAAAGAVVAAGLAGAAVAAGAVVGCGACVGTAAGACVGAAAGAAGDGLLHAVTTTIMAASKARAVRFMVGSPCGLTAGGRIRPRGF